VSGSPSNVVGLPLELIRSMLTDLDRRLGGHGS
jgi:predicted house-cleaning NTP pyrophosphatase (Maf/HAM1 superfamily)